MNMMLRMRQPGYVATLLPSHARWLVGVETDINWLPLSGSARGDAVGNEAWDYTVFENILSTRKNTTWLGTLRPRLGFLVTDSLLVFGTGGLAYGDRKESANVDYVSTGYGNTAYPYNTDSTHAGWTAGGGIEGVMKTCWSVKLEYLYYDLGSKTVIADPTVISPPFQTKYTLTNSSQIIRLGMNYHFK